ncbi:MAG: DUF2917 domain-containing protein [Hydrogenophaga sp.]
MPHQTTRISTAHKFPGAAGRPAGFWRLKRGHALGLRPAGAAQLRLVRGQVWVTLGQGDSGGLCGTRAGDIALRAGDVLSVPAGARLVMEPLCPLDGADVLFDWSDAPGAERVQRAGRFRHEVVAPATELAEGLRQVLRASARLVRGVLAYGEFVVAGRGRVLGPLEGNPP